MTARVRFFARFRELLGTDINVTVREGTHLLTVVKGIAEKNKDGYDAIFDASGAFREFVIIMQNGRRIDTAAAGTVPVADGDEIAIFPPVAGG